MNPAEVTSKSKFPLPVEPIKKIDTSNLKNNVCLFKEIHPAVPLRHFQVHWGSKESYNIKYNTFQWKAAQGMKHYKNTHHTLYKELKEIDVNFIIILKYKWSSRDNIMSMIRDH